MQYFSPYLYSGNSPISFVDPDGQFAFLIVVAVAAVAGAYLGAASANDSWNPFKWNYRNPQTYVHAGIGALGKSF